MASNPWMTSNDIIEAVKRKIAFPVSQNTFSEEDILRFANEEMFISQVPSVLQYHEEYFVYRVQTPLVSNISRYPVPDRAIGMRLRDLMWSDSSGNFFEMTRINADDKAFFQRNIGANQAIHKFYLENNDVVLTPSVIGGPTGNLNFFIFLRPNQLVANDRARVIQSFSQDITVANNSLVAPGDKVFIQLASQAVNTITIPFIAINNSVKTISTITAGNPGLVTTTNAHDIPIDVEFEVTITGATPLSVNGVYAAISTGSNTFELTSNVPVSATGGTYAITNSFQIDATAALTAANLQTAITNAALDEFTNTVNGSVVTCTFGDVTNLFTSGNSNAIVVSSQIGFNFNTELSSLYSVGSKIDFLQTKPGHKTYVFDVRVKAVTNPSVGVYCLKVNRNDLLIELSNGYGFVPQIANILTGDYVCLAGESIIPQIPPDLHNMLAEKTAARILASLGDQAGLAMANDKIKEMEYRQGSLLDDRVDGAPQKITARHSILRYLKMGVRKRM